MEREESIRLPVELVLEDGLVRYASFQQGECEMYLNSLTRCRGNANGLRMEESTAVIVLPQRLLVSGRRDARKG